MKIVNLSCIMFMYLVICCKKNPCFLMTNRRMEKINRGITVLYDRFKCKISHEGKLSEFIEVRNGVRQRCILSPTLFLLILDRVMRRMKGLRKRGIQWSMKERLEDLDYADDICLLGQRLCDMDGKQKRLKEQAELAGLHINTLRTGSFKLFKHPFPGF